MKVVRAILLGTLLAAVLVAAGCKKKKPPLPPPQATAPTITEPAPQPAAPPVEETKPEPSATPPAPAPESSAEKPKPKPRLRPHHAARKEPPKEPAKEPAKPSRTVVPDGSAPSGGQLSATIPGATATNRKFNTAQLLEATDYNLKSVTRALTDDEQAIVQHIRSFMQQSREATAQGDTERAYNLALKAHMMSDEIAKR